MFQNKLSPIYRQLLPDAVRQMEVPEEKFADCDNCHHCQSAKNFRYETKCCDYHPRLPNYMVGAILSDNSKELAEGKQRILTKIANRKGITPYGIIAPMDYHQKFKANRAKKGKHAPQAEMTALKCPYFAEDGRCTIYKYRSDICPVFYCMSSSGAKGSRFWNLAYQYITAVERKLTLYALQEQGYPSLEMITSPVGPATFKLETGEDVVKEKAYQQLWKKWAGQEIAFYKNCYKAVVELNATDVTTLMGLEENIMGEQLQSLAKKMAKINIPDFLQLDTNHSLYQDLKNNQAITLTDGKILKFSPIQSILLKSFQGTTPTLEIVQKGNLMKQNVVHFLVPLMEEGLLGRV